MVVYPFSYPLHSERPKTLCSFGHSECNRVNKVTLPPKFAFSEALTNYCLFEICRDYYERRPILLINHITQYTVSSRTSTFCTDLLKKVCVCQQTESPR